MRLSIVVALLSAVICCWSLSAPAAEELTGEKKIARQLGRFSTNTQFNKDGVKFHGGLSGKLTNWTESDFKEGVYKKFLLYYKGKQSTQKQTNKDVSDCLLALTSHIAQDHGSTMPMFPSIENMSFAALLKV